MKNLKRFLLQLAMLNRLVSFLFSAEWSSLINSIPALRTACDALSEAVTSLNQKLSKYQSTLAGIARNKRDARKKLATSSYAIMSSARSWFIKNNNFEMADKLNVSFSELIHMPYALILSKSSHAVTIIEPIIGQLTNFNVTPAAVDSWKQDINNLHNLFQGPQSAIQVRKAMGKDLNISMKDTMTFLDDELTPLMSNFLTNNVFYLAFFGNKRIGNVTEHHTRLEATVISDAGQPQYAITVTVNAFTDPQTGKHYHAQSAVTNVQGFCEVSGFFPGNRTVTISGSTIQSKTFPAINFKIGEAVKQTFVAQQNFPNLPPSPVNEAQKEKA